MGSRSPCKEGIEQHHLPRQLRSTDWRVGVVVVSPAPTYPAPCFFSWWMAPPPPGCACWRVYALSSFHPSSCRASSPVPVLPRSFSQTWAVAPGSQLVSMPPGPLSLPHSVHHTPSLLSNIGIFLGAARLQPHSLFQTRMCPLLKLLPGSLSVPCLSSHASDPCCPLLWLSLG